MTQHVCKLSLSFKTSSLLNNGLELAFQLAVMMALMAFFVYEIDSVYEWSPQQPKRYYSIGKIKV